MRRHDFSRRRIMGVFAVTAILTLAFSVLPEAVFAEGAKLPVVLRQPADATYAENATARFYVSASSPEGGYLTYQWYRSEAFPAPVSDPNGDGKAA
ncbi:MAG: hypothetical protein LBL49_02765, partial [Clostridiales Family XIII bacterium]|nr:hypothetical protein [Clostridiales Family XIII bacterium]